MTTTTADKLRESQARSIQARREANGLDARDARIKEMAAEGYKNSEIGAEVGLTGDMVRKILLKNAPKTEEPAPAGDEVQQRLVAIALDRIDPNPWQPRTSLDEGHVADLADNIFQVGLLHDPMVRPAGDGVRYQLAHGHHRIEAIRLLHSKGDWGASVDCKVEALTDEQMAYIALSENRGRKQLTTIEEIRGWAKAVEGIEAG